MWPSPPPTLQEEQMFSFNIATGTTDPVFNLNYLVNQIEIVSIEEKFPNIP